MSDVDSGIDSETEASPRDPATQGTLWEAPSPELRFYTNGGTTGSDPNDSDE